VKSQIISFTSKEMPCRQDMCNLMPFQIKAIHTDTDLAQNRPPWSTMSTYGAMQF